MEVSPTSYSSSSSISTTTNKVPVSPTGPPNQNVLQSPGLPRPVTRFEHANHYPTTFVQADASSFKQVVQMLTGSSKPDTTPPAPPPPLQLPAKAQHYHSIPPIKTTPKKGGSGFKLYERRNSLKSLKINPLATFPGQAVSGASPHNQDILSPSILDFPALVLSPVTPLTYGPFTRSPRPAYESFAESPNMESEAGEKAKREKGFFLRPSPGTTPRNPEPRLLPLFPLSSPKVSGSSSSN